MAERPSSFPQAGRTRIPPGELNLNNLRLRQEPSLVEQTAAVSSLSMPVQPNCASTSNNCIQANKSMPLQRLGFQSQGIPGERKKQLTLTIQDHPKMSVPSTIAHNSQFHPFGHDGEINHFHNPHPSRNADARARERLKIQASGKLQLGPREIYHFTSDDMEDLGEIGRGAFGAVNKMIFKKTDMVMAVKRIRSTVDEKEQKQLLMDLEVVMKSNECNYIVQFFGALFKEGDCWICMELMDTSLDKFYKYIYEKKGQRIPESILAKITVATVNALNYLKEKLKIIHRDVKPSNILLHKRGDIKLCDFGISGQLVDSIAKTKDAGCRPYMAPERIDPERAKGYDVRSDVWSLGITLMEVATGNFPYRKWDSVFEQLCQVVQGDPPRLQPSYNGMEFSTEFVDFVNTCLIKNESERPKYSRLLQMAFILRGERSHIDVAAYVTDTLESMENDGITQFTTNQPAES